MRDNKPGDLSARIGFSTVMGTGPEAGQLRPTIEITCQTSGLSINLELTPTQLAEMLAGRTAQVLAAQVSGFPGLVNWGKYSQHTTRTVDVRPGDYQSKNDPRGLPHLAPVIAEMRDEGWRVDMPRRNNAGEWVLTGRKYVDQP